jgi:hypothetical protein
MKDAFLHTLSTKLNTKMLSRLCLRKAAKISNEAFESFFSQNMPVLKYLNLDESTSISDSALEQISKNCVNLKKLNLCWCP